MPWNEKHTAKLFCPLDLISKPLLLPDVLCNLQKHTCQEGLLLTRQCRLFGAEGIDDITIST